jgi:glycosyltransferase involved in cell wall biosynthesis
MGTKDYTEPLVTVIIGTKDRAKIIHRAIDSVLGQTYKNIECIIIDGDSQDNTEEIIGLYNDSRIKYIHLSPNPGRGEALKIAMIQAKGEYIVVLDDDDEFLPQKIEKQVAVLMNTNENVGLAYSWTRFWDDGKNIQEEILRNTIRGYVFPYLLDSHALCSFPALMFKKTALKKVGYYFNRTPIDSDWQFACRLCKQFEVEFVPEILQVVHRNHLYERLSLAKTVDKNSLINTLNFNIDFLDEFKDDYAIFRKKQFVHLIPIIGNSSRIKNHEIFFKYSVKAFFINPFSKELIGQFIKGLFRFIIPNKYS